MLGNVIPGSISGRVHAPASKSAMQRAVAMAVLADGDSYIENPSDCADSLFALSMAKGLGADVALEERRIRITGSHGCGETNLNAGESGLGLRMFTPVAACFDGPVTIGASGSLMQRPVDMLVDGLSALGINCRSTDGLPPVTVTGPLNPGRVTVDGSVTSQFLTGLLIALASRKGDSEITVTDLKSRPYVRMTVDMLEQFGARIDWTPEDVFHVAGTGALTPASIMVEGDWSGAASILCAGAIAGSVTVTGLNPDSLQADRAVVHALEQIGADVSMESDGTVQVQRTDLQAFSFDVTHCPDLVPVLTAVALTAPGISRFTGTGRLKYKESHRPKVLAEQFERLGGNIQVEDDSMTITGGKLAGGEVDAKGDHRIAMALAIAGLAAEGPVQIHGIDCVAKSYPDFFLDLSQLSGQHHDTNETGGRP